MGSFGKRCLIEVGEGIEKKGQAFLPTLVSSFKFPFAVFHIPTIQRQKKFILGELEKPVHPNSLIIIAIILMRYLVLPLKQRGRSSSRSHSWEVAKQRLDSTLGLLSAWNFKMVKNL